MGSRSVRGRARQSERYCEGKVIHKRVKQAKSASSATRAALGHDNVSYYKCPRGAHYHTGHNRPRDERKGQRPATELTPEQKQQRYIAHLGHIAGALWESIGG